MFKLIHGNDLFSDIKTSREEEEGFIQTWRMIMMLMRVKGGGKLN